MLGRRADVVSVREIGADEVVVATGARFEKPDVFGADLAHVQSVPEIAEWLRAEDRSVGARVVVLGGGKAGISIADVCIRRGRSVTVIEPTNVFCGELGLPGRWRLVADIEAAGARLVGSAAVVGIARDSVDVRVEGEIETIPADTVIVTAPRVPDTELVDACRHAGITVHTVGDCDTIRSIEGANLDAAHLALTLG